jgi:hypothetical protein
MAHNYNPYKQKLKSLELKRLDILKEIDHIESQNSWFNKFNIDEFTYNITYIKKRALEFKEKIELSKKKIKKLDSDIKESLKNSCSKFNILKKFTLDQRYRKREQDNLRKLLEETQENLTADLKGMDYFVKDMNEKEEEYLKYKKFDLQNNILLKEKYEIDLGSCNEELIKIRNIYNNIENAISPIIPIIQEKVSEIEKVKDQIAEAKEYSEALSSETNPYERKLIHEECEDRFGDGSPAKVITRLSGLIEKLNRNLDKLTDRLESEVRKNERDVRKVIIDGNNLCHNQNTGKFIGLSILKRLIPVLKKKYKILVIFDWSIRKTFSNEDISNQLKGIEFLIAEKGEKADSLVFDTATDLYAVVLSNDNFVDYQEKFALKNKLVIKYNLLSDRLIINDLNINMEIDEACT